MAEELTEPGGSIRLYVETPLSTGVRVDVDEGQAHYLVNVMRARPGDRVRLFNGRDGEWLARVAEVTKRGCALECEAQTAPYRAVPDLWLVFAPIKKTPADYVVQKATELGVRVLQPVLTRRTIARRVNLERMRANGVEAAEQSGRVDAPEVRDLVELERLLAAWPGERKLLFCDEAGEAPSIAEALRALPRGQQPREPWAVLTGPEGGFDPAERALVREQPFTVPAALGERILRADTAALAALAVWQSILGDWG
ncbi:MAG: 16S rRNA (uracil(1498)-N(3))-methyltransferase [Alphaproteobacteria bacterium]|nr:16S rRNA (uracil(1498)-N(3))-methyltransferase [Alphaproteobacteria bacterium]